MTPSRAFSLQLPLFSFFFSMYFEQDVLLAAKRARLDQIVGSLKEKEEEPEGEALGDSDTGSLEYF